MVKQVSHGIYRSIQQIHGKRVSINILQIGLICAHLCCLYEIDSLDICLIDSYWLVERLFEEQTDNEILMNSTNQLM